jgi:hypothetical protein
MNAGDGSPAADPASSPAAKPPEDGKPKAPVAGQADAVGTPTTGTPAAEDKPVADAPLTEEDLLKAGLEKLGVKAKEPETPEHWRKQYEASSKEGRILAAQLGAMKNALLKQGLDIVHGKEGIGFKANKDYTAKEVKAITEGLLKGLTDQDRAVAMDDPNAFAELLASRMLEGRVPEPTVTKVEIDDSTAEKIRTALESAKEGDAAELPEFKALWPFMEALMIEPSDAAQSFRDFMRSSDANYAYGLRLLHGRVYQRLSPLLQRQAELKRLQEEKRAASRDDVSLASEETRSSGRGGKPKSEAEAIAGAKW